MNDATPARLIKPKDLDANSTAFREVLRHVPKKNVDSVLDIRYGLGGWAREIRDRFPTTIVEGYEADPDTASQAWTDSLVRLYPRPWPVKGGDYDLVVADFNVVTTKSRGPLVQLLGCVSARYLVFTDVACVKLHLNYRSYGLDSPDLNAYWRGFDLPGWKILGWSRKHHAASTSVWKKEAPVLSRG